MKTIIITTAIVLSQLASFGQRTIKITKEFPAYEVIGNTAFASNKQIKTTDSLRKCGFMPVGVRGSGKGTIIVTFFKSVK